MKAKNMKKLSLFLLLILAQYSFGQIFNKTIKGQGEIVSKEFKIDKFSNLKMRGSMDFFLVNNTNQNNVVVETYANLIKYFKVKQEDGILKIGLKKHANISYRKPFNVYIPVSPQTLKSISLLGSGDVNSSLTFQGENLVVRLSGSGDISLKVAVDKLEANLLGSGDLAINGKAKNSELKLSGSGDLTAKELISNSVKAKLTGSGDLSAYATDSIDANLVGSGDLYYSGNPKQVSQNIVGSGDIHKR